MAFTHEAWYAATSDGIVVSRDRGTTWKLAGKDQFVKQPAQSVETSLDGSQVWAIAQRSLIYSADKGAHWEAKEAPVSASAVNLHLHRIDDLNLFITSSLGLYASKDAGRAWSRVDIRELQFQDVTGTGGALVAALQKHGLLASSDGGKSWQHINSPLADGYFPLLHVRRDGTVVAASATEGLLAFEPDARSADAAAAAASHAQP
jgi:photosystem II stability/assembly factor-like uncharacterized protein